MDFEALGPTKMNSMWTRMFILRILTQTKIQKAIKQRQIRLS